MTSLPYVHGLDSKDPVKAAHLGQWDVVFETLGCSLTLKDTHSEPTPSGKGSQGLQQAPAGKDDDIQQTSGNRLTTVLDAVRHDFWQTDVPLEGDTDDCMKPVHVSDIIARDVFPSVSIELTITYVDTHAESEILKMALKQDDWKTITVILFLLTKCGLDTEESEIAIRRAAESKDWRYVTAVAGTVLKAFHFKPHFLMDALGLDPETVLLDRANRIDAIRNLVGFHNRNKSLLTLIITTVISWAKQESGQKVVRKWIIPLEIMEDFSYKTDAVENYFSLCLNQEECKRIDSCFELSEYAVTNRVLFLISVFARHTYLTRSQVNRAVRVSAEAGDWDTFLVCVMAGADLSQYVQGSTVLQTALWIGPFNLKPEHLSNTDMNHRNSEGLTLLHTAIEHWRKDRSVHGKRNISTLCEHGADFRIPYPSGETVMQKILNHPKKEEKREEINELIMVCVTYVADRGILIDWEMVSGVGKNLLHVVCENGAYLLVHQLIHMGVDPLHHRNKFTLFDTAISAKDLSNKDRIQVLCALCAYPQIIRNHQSAVSIRLLLSLFPCNLPLHTLITQLLAEGDRYFEIIKFLASRNIFIQAEYRKALGELEPLKKAGLHEVADFLESKVKWPRSTGV